MSVLTVALGEYDTGWHAPGPSLDRADDIARLAAAAGTRVVVLPEMATTGFTMDRDQAVPLDGPDATRLREIASRHGIWLIAGLAVRDAAPDEPHRTSNVALAIDPRGEVKAVHRKQRMFAFAGEDRSYSAGASSTIVAIDGVRVALFVCYELRFPELFAAVASDADAMIVIANWPAARRSHWDALLCARAIESQCAVVGVNRIGVADGVVYDGGSMAFDPWGEPIVPVRDAGVPIVSLDAAAVARVRERYPFLRDRVISP